MDIKNFTDKKIAIVWYGKEWRSTLRYLLKQGISPKQVTVCDQQEQLHLKYNVKTQLGDAYLEKMNVFDIVIKSAWVPPWLPWLVDVQEKITSNMQLFLDHYPGKVIWITGTKWKSTISSLLFHILQELWINVWFGGNIGTPPLDMLEEVKELDFMILECSSYQLYNIHYQFHIWVLSTLFHEHHIKRHGTFEAYREAKYRLLKNSTIQCVGSQVYDDRWDELEDMMWEHTTLFGHRWAITFRDGFFWYNEDRLFTDEMIQLPGDHNRYNICWVLSICDRLEIDLFQLKPHLESFHGLRHRCEDLWVHHGIRWINDAIATTPEATIAALDTFGEDVDTIFLWWTDGWYDFSELLQKLEDYNVKTVILFPDSWERIKWLLDSSYTVYTTDSMKDAVKFARENSAHWKIALLSCASPSYSLWSGFEEKGNLFRKCVVDEM